MIITIDIETLPTENPEIIERIASKIKPPGNIKKAESIAKWEAEEKEQAVLDAVSKTGLNGLYGSVFCFGVKVNYEKAIVFYEENEKDMLIKAAEYLNSLVDNQHTIKTAGHNICGFDLRFLFQRFCINGIKPPLILPFNAKPWDSCVFDTMVQWAGHGSFVSLDDLCLAFGIESSKADINGSKVAEYYKAGMIDEILKYCADDVEKTYQIAQKMSFGELR